MPITALPFELGYKMSTVTLSGPKRASTMERLSDKIINRMQTMIVTGQVAGFTIRYYGIDIEVVWINTANYSGKKGYRIVRFPTDTVRMLPINKLTIRKGWDLPLK
jgi:hypothetical protein